jgi:hypothetical protein
MIEPESTAPACSKELEERRIGAMAHADVIDV